jgi:hypothetical protein
MGPGLATEIGGLKAEGWWSLHLYCGGGTLQRRSLADRPSHTPASEDTADVRFEVFHCSDYEECRLLGYKNPFRTSQETHYVPTTELSQLLLCKI